MGLLTGEAGELPAELGEPGVPSAFLFLLGVEGRDPKPLEGLGGDFFEEARCPLDLEPRGSDLLDVDLLSRELVLGLRERLRDFLASVAWSTDFVRRTPAAACWSSLISPLSSRFFREPSTARLIAGALTIAIMQAWRVRMVEAC